MGALILFTGFFGIVVATVFLLEVYSRFPEQALKGLVASLDGVVVSRRGRQVIEIPDEPDRPIRYELRQWNRQEGTSFELTVISIPIQLKRPTKIDLVSQSRAEVQRLLSLFVTDSLLPTELAGKLADRVEIGDQEFEDRYFVYSDRPEEAKDIIEEAKPFILSVWNAAWRLSPAPSWAKNKDHVLTVAFNERIIDPEQAQRLVVAVDGLAKAIRNRHFRRPTYPGVSPFQLPWR